MPNTLKDEILSRLNAKTIHELRQLGRALGVPHPADGKKEQLLDGIMAVATGAKDPETPSKRGAPPKSQEYDRQLASDVLRCREICLSEQITDDTVKPIEIFVGNGDRNSFDYIDGGILEFSGDKWFLRTTGCRENLSADVFVNEYFVKAYNLRRGDYVTGRCERRSRDEMAGLATVINVNGLRPEDLSNRRYFETFNPMYADKKLSFGNLSPTCRAIDLLAPVGVGQRVLVTAPRGCGKTQVLKDVAAGISDSNKTAKIVIVPIDVSPEEAADFAQSFKGADVFASPFDAGTAAHIRTAELALEYCKRQTELLQDVVLIVDDITRLLRAYSSYSRQAVAGLDYSAIDSVKRLLASARNTDKGASLTIIAAMSCGNGDAVEEAGYSALKDVFNVKIALSLQLARNRIYPPIDFTECYSSLAMRLLTEGELNLAAKLKNSENEKILELFGKTSDNRQLSELLG